MSDLRTMSVGSLVDFVIDFNERQDKAKAKAEKEEKHGKKRKATQSDINAFFG